VNKLRKFPKSFIPILEDHLNYFEGDTLFLPGSAGGVILDEGPAAYEDAIKYLKEIGSKPRKELVWSNLLERAA